MSYPNVPLPLRYFTDPYYLIQDQLVAEEVAARLKGMSVPELRGSEVYDEYLYRTENRCPVCNNDTLEKGESVHIDFGHYQQVDPDICRTCGYIQQGAQPDGPTFDKWSFQWLWEMQINPYPTEP